MIILYSNVTSLSGYSFTVCACAEIEHTKALKWL